LQEREEGKDNQNPQYLHANLRSGIIRIGITGPVEMFENGHLIPLAVTSSGIPKIQPAGIEGFATARQGNQNALI
jgi:hypothetical protein